MTSREQICYYIKHSCLQSLQDTIAEEKLSLNFKSEYLEDLTPLQYAAAKGDTELVKYIISLVNVYNSSLILN